MLLFTLSFWLHSQTADKLVFITVKTSSRSHEIRLKYIIDTWFQMARDHIYFITDAEDPQVESKVNKGHLVVTSCGKSHSYKDLCCKMGYEFDTYFDLGSNYKWFCHFDDDNYVNIPKLTKELNQYDPYQHSKANSDT